MNSKYILTLLTLLAITFSVKSQYITRDLPPETFIEHYTLAIGYNATTVLIFPASIKPGDKGTSDHEFIIQKQPGAENILKLKAARQDFTPSNLHVFTSDGKIYAFDVSFAPNPD